MEVKYFTRDNLIEASEDSIITKQAKLDKQKAMRHSENTLYRVVWAQQEDLLTWLVQAELDDGLDKFYISTELWLKLTVKEEDLTKGPILDQYEPDVIDKKNK